MESGDASDPEDCRPCASRSASRALSSPGFGNFVVAPAADPDEGVLSMPCEYDEEDGSRLSAASITSSRADSWAADIGAAASTSRGASGVEKPLLPLPLSSPESLLTMPCRWLEARVSADPLTGRGTATDLAAAFLPAAPCVSFSPFSRSRLEMTLLPMGPASWECQGDNDGEATDRSLPLLLSLLVLLRDEDAPAPPWRSSRVRLLSSFMAAEETRYGREEARHGCLVGLAWPSRHADVQMRPKVVRDRHQLRRVLRASRVLVAALLPP